jgi:hypothetical protein
MTSLTIDYSAVHGVCTAVSYATQTDVKNPIESKDIISSSHQVSFQLNSDLTDIAIGILFESDQTYVDSDGEEDFETIFNLVCVTLPNSSSVTLFLDGGINGVKIVRSEPSLV